MVVVLPARPCGDDDDEKYGSPAKKIADDVADEKKKYETKEETNANMTMHEKHELSDAAKEFIKNHPKPEA